MCRRPNRKHNSLHWSTMSAHWWHSSMVATVTHTIPPWGWETGVLCGFFFTQSCHRVGSIVCLQQFFPSFLGGLLATDESLPPISNLFSTLLFFSYGVFTTPASTNMVCVAQGSRATITFKSVRLSTPWLQKGRFVQLLKCRHYINSCVYILWMYVFICAHVCINMNNEPCKMVGVKGRERLCCVVSCIIARSKVLYLCPASWFL